MSLSLSEKRVPRIAQMVDSFQDCQKSSIKCVFEQYIPAKMMKNFVQSMTEADALIAKTAKEENDATLEEAGIAPSWILTYGIIAHRFKEYQDFGLTRYPYK